MNKIKTARENEQIQKKKKYSCHFKMSLNFKIPIYHHLTIQGFPWGSAGKKNLPTMGDTWVQPPGWEDFLEKGKVTHTSILAGRIPWTM